MKTLIFLAFIAFFANTTNPDKSDFVNYLQHQSRNELVTTGANASFYEYITDTAFSLFNNTIKKSVVRESFGICSLYVIDIPFTDNDPVYIGIFNSFYRLDNEN